MCSQHSTIPPPVAPKSPHKPLLKLGIQLGTNLITAHALNLEQDVLPGVVLQQGVAQLAEALQTLLEDVNVVVGPLDERLAGSVVPARDAGRVEGGVVDAAGGFVDPAAGNALEDDREGGDDGDGEINGDDSLEGGGLVGGAGVAVEDEGGVGVVGRLGH